LNFVGWNLLIRLVDVLIRSWKEKKKKRRRERGVSEIRKRSERKLKKSRPRTE